MGDSSRQQHISADNQERAKGYFPATKLSDKLLARDNDLLNMRETYSTLLHRVQSIRYSHNILDSKPSISQGRGGYALEDPYLPAIELAIN